MMNLVRTFFLTSAIIALTLAACGPADDTVEIDSAAAEATSTPTSTPAAPEPGSIKKTGPDATILDVKNSDIVSFLEQYQFPESALGALAPDSIDQAIDDSTAIVIAKVEDLIDEGKFPTESEGEDLQRLGIVLKPIKVLRGALQTGLKDVIIGRLDAPENVKKLADTTPPKGVAVFFLRWAGAYPHPNIPDDEPTEYERTHYIWTHITTVYAQGRDHVFSPMATENQKAGQGQMTSSRSASAYAKLSGFVDRVRNSNSKLRRPGDDAV